LATGGNLPKGAIIDDTALLGRLGEIIVNLHHVHIFSNMLNRRNMEMMMLNWQQLGVL